jgi:hypothetical protein
VTVTGNAYGGSVNGANGIQNNTTGTVTVTGNAYGGSAGGAIGINNNTTGTVTVTGNAYGGSVSSAYGIQNNSTGTVTQNGVAFASALAIAAVNNSTGSFTLTKSVGNGYGPGTSGITSTVGASNSTTGNFYISQLQFGALGQTPTQGCFILTPSTSNTVQFYKSPALPNISSATWTSPTTGTITFAANHGLTTGTQIVLSAFQDPTASWNGTFTVTVTSSTQVTISGPTSSPTVNGSATLLSSTKTLVDAAATAGVIPSASDVRTGVSYNAGSNIGTLAVPAAGSVALGVAVDNTTGTAVLTAANVQTALTSQGLTTTRAGKLDNLDAAISTRLASSGYTAPDNTGIAAIKAKTDNLPSDPASNTQVNTRLASSGYTAPDNTSIAAIKAKTDANLDAAVSTRLAASGYTAPDNASIAGIKAKTDALPASPAPAGDTTGLTAYGASTLTKTDVTNAVIPVV